MKKPVSDIFGSDGLVDDLRIEGMTADLEKAVAKKPDDLRSLLLLGNGYYLQGRISKSIEVFGRALVLSPDNPYACYYLGISQYRSANITEAITALRKVTTKAPSLVMAYYWLGMAYFHCGNYAEAREAFETLLQKNEESHIANYQAAVICMFQRDYPVAIKHLEALVKLGSKDPQVYLRLGDCYSNLFKTPDATRAYRAGLAACPGNAPLKKALEDLVEVQSP